MAGVDVLRCLWAFGEVRVTTRADGALSLVPSANVTPELVQLAKDARAEIAAVVRELPAPGRCSICGAPTGWPEKTGLHCGDCMGIGLERVLAERGDISRKAVKEAVRA
jgi:hypothetical protein